MRFRNFGKVLSPGLILAAIFLFSVEASATPTGTLRMDSGVQFVTVGLTFIDWAPTGPPSGAFVVGGLTNLTSALGPVTVGSAGPILDFNALTPLPLVNFMTFAAVPGLGFDLTGIGPGTANTNCAALLNGQSCSIFIGSPIILTLNGSSTSVSLNAFGTAHDGTLPNSTWTGNFTTQIAGRTPAQIQADFGCT